MKRIIVQKYGWLSEADFMEALSMAQVLPGATSVDMMGYFGHRLIGPWGAICMSAAYVTPAFLLVALLAKLYFSYGNIGFVHSVMTGMGALVVALLVMAILQLSRNVVGQAGRITYRASFIALFTFVLSYFFHINAIFVIIAAGLAGFVLYYFSDKASSAKQTSRLVVSPVK